MCKHVSQQCNSSSTTTIATHSPKPHSKWSLREACAPEVSPQPIHETVAIFLWPTNQPYAGCLLRLGAQPVLLLLAGLDGCRGLHPLTTAWLSPRLASRNSPLGATGAGAGAAALAAAEAAWCCGTGGGTRGRTGSTPHCSWTAAARKWLISPTPHNPEGPK